MSMAGLAGCAARRRRERQLRSFLRHEELSVKMALARGEQHYAPRRQKPPLLGKRPGLPPEPEPQVRGSYGRLRGCPGASPLSTVAGGHCSRSSGRPHGVFPLH